MTEEQFKEECKKPVDIGKCREALQRLIDGKFTLNVPANPKDEDILISRALDELEASRNVVKAESKVQEALRLLGVTMMNNEGIFREPEMIFTEIRQKFSLIEDEDTKLKIVSWLLPQ